MTDPSNPSIHTDTVIRCLMVYPGESTDQLLKEYDDADEDNVAQDHTTQKIKIYTVEGSEDVGIVLEGLKVVTALDNIPRACCMLVGLVYAVNLAYPKELRYTFEVFQKLLELDYKAVPESKQLQEQTVNLIEWTLVEKCICHCSKLTRG